MKMLLSNGRTALRGTIPTLRRRASALDELSLSQLNSSQVTGISTSLLKKFSLIAAAFLVVTSVIPANVGALQAMDIHSYDNANDAFVLDQEGYLTKINPQTNESDRSMMSDRFEYTVESGDTLSGIAAKYNLKMKTLIWENGFSSQDQVLRVGQKIIVPPVDGVSYTVASGETMDKLAKLYGVDKAAIMKQNQLTSEALAKGQSLYIPGGKRLVAEVDVTSTKARAATPRIGSVSRVKEADLASSSATPAEGKFMIFPTRGKLTQGFKAGHYAFDIADSSKPPIWAAAKGTVVKASSGTWGGGYGNHVIIDHGNGVQTLYAHLEYLDVKVGDAVEQGQVLGKMGHTGRVYGVTGIHLHFEVRVNGVKKVPNKYY